MTWEIAVTPAELRDLALAHGRAKKRNNAVAAVFSGVIPAVTLALFASPTWQRVVLGILIGLVWGNAFEYSYHRWLLHWPHSSFGKGHLAHHSTVGFAEEAEHVTLGESPRDVVTLFLINGIPLMVVDLALHIGISPGVFLGWAAYLICMEEIHWRVHLDPNLPSLLRFAQSYHLAHHDIPNARYNVFIPVFDIVLGTAGRAKLKVRS
jgi:hypothetical protein